MGPRQVQHPDGLRLSVRHEVAVVAGCEADVEISVIVMHDYHQRNAHGSNVNSVSQQQPASPIPRRLALISGNRPILPKLTQVQVLYVTATDGDLKGFNVRFASGACGYVILDLSVTNRSAPDVVCTICT